MPTGNVRGTGKDTGWNSAALALRQVEVGRNQAKTLMVSDQLARPGLRMISMALDISPDAA